MNDKEVTSADSHFETSCKDYVCKLDITDVNEDLVGVIKVVAKNPNGQDQREASEY